MADSLEVGLGWLGAAQLAIGVFVHDGIDVCWLQLERQGTQHQAGSDSYLTGAAFFKMKQVSVYMIHIIVYTMH